MVTMGRIHRNGPGAADSPAPLLERWLRDHVAPVARDLTHTTWTPGPAARRAVAAAYRAHLVAREALELARRSLVATPTFLSLCESHGERVSVDRVPYIAGFPRLIAGSDLRISGQIDILSGVSGDAVLRIGNGVFIGHRTTFVVRRHIEIGDYSAIAGGCYIADTDGHSHARLGVPIWEDRTADADPVIIEDNVHVARGCIILRGVRVGAGSILGAGAVVRADVPPGTVMIGNPARAAAWRRAREGG